MSNLSDTDLRQFTGDLQRFRHALNRRVIYTPGVQYVAEQAGAYWLIDEIALYLGTSPFRAALAADVRIGQLHFWKLEVRGDRSFTLRGRADGDVVPFAELTATYTDFPLPEFDIWAGFDGEHWTLYLPSEH